MKKTLSTLKLNALVFSLLFGLLSLQVLAQTDKPFSINESPLPAPTEPVNDFAGVLDENTKQTLNQRLKALKAGTNPQVVLAVAIVKTTGDRPIFDYSLAVSRGWKIGTKDDDNPSALLFIAIDDRKYFTQVSRNLEDELPDGVVGQLQRQYLVPAFKQGNYSKGVTDTIDAYIRTIAEKGNAQTVPAAGTEKRGAKESSSGGFCSIVTCLIILFVLMLIIFSRFGSNKNKNDRNRWGGGGGFGGGSALPWIIGGVLGSMGNNDRGSSGGWGSGGGSSGGGDWGGFGGGGDFGGGGAGGDW